MPDDAIERFYKRYFWWVEGIVDKFERLKEIWDELSSVVKFLGATMLGFMVGAITFWVAGVSFQRPWLTIPSEVVVGWIGTARSRQRWLSLV